MCYDVVICGFGFAALLSAIALHDAGAKVLMLASDFHAKPLEGRIFAIASESKVYLDKFDIFDSLSKEICEITDIVVADGESRLHYDSQTVGRPMGYTVQASHLFSVMLEIAGKKVDCQIGTVQNIEFQNSFAHLQLTDGSIIKTSLIVCVEGKHSFIRKSLGVSVLKLNYNQSIATFVISHTLNHESLAFEKFMDGGPLAILPMSGGYNSSVIFTEHADKFDAITENKSELLKETKNRMLSFLGDISIESDVFKYNPLFVLPNRLYEKRVVFIADSAHAIHPVAGQGFNLGIRDIKSLAENVEEFGRDGIDIGSQFVLKAYSKSRYKDILLTSFSTDLIARLFAARNNAVKNIRRSLVSFVNNDEVIKRIMMRYAMGYTSDYI